MDVADYWTPTPTRVHAPPAVCAPHIAAAQTRALWIGLVVGLVVALLVSVLVWILLPSRTVVIHMLEPATPTTVLRPQRHAPAIRAALGAWGGPRVRAAKDKQRLVVPAVYSIDDEGFVVKLRVGADDVLAVLDSGSAHLSVGTASCVKDELCSAHDGAYRPGASTTAVDLHAPAVLNYASLAVQASWWRDTLTLYGMPDAKSDKPGAPPALEDDGATTTVPVSDVTVAAATRMDGTASNILGLMASHTSTSSLSLTSIEPTPVLEQVLAGLQLPRRWGLAAGSSGAGYLVLGTPPELPGMAGVRHVPMSSEFSFLGAPCVDIKAMRFRKPGQSGWTALDPAPKYAVLDTGTTQTYATTPFIDSFENVAGLPAPDAVLTHDAVKLLPEIQVELANGLSLVYGPRQYMVDSQGGGQRTTLCCGETVITQLLGTKPVLLVGIHHLMGLYLDVDLEGRRVGFGRLSSSF